MPRALLEDSALEEGEIVLIDRTYPILRTGI
jgi:hypothetical protein